MITEQKMLQTTGYDLHLFKMLLEKSKTGLHHKPYSTHKFTIYGYKAAFFAISFFFLLISLYLYSTSISWMAQFIFGGSGKARVFFCSMAAIFSIISFYYGYAMVPHRELASNIARRAKKKLRRLYTKKLFFLSYQRIIEASDLKDAEISWKFSYEDLLEGIDESLLKAKALLDRIWMSKSLSLSEKEKLFNEALFEFESETQKMVSNFSSGHTLSD